jgi:hypothetical protein
MSAHKSAHCHNKGLSTHGQTAATRQHFRPSVRSNRRGNRGLEPPKAPLVPSSTRDCSLSSVAYCATALGQHSLQQQQWDLSGSLPVRGFQYRISFAAQLLCSMELSTLQSIVRTVAEWPLQRAAYRSQSSKQTDQALQGKIQT